MADDTTGRRQPIISAADLDNLGWFWRSYFRSRWRQIALALALIGLQGLIYQQFLSWTEQGLRTIFSMGGLRELAVVCAAVFALFVVRGMTAYFVPFITVRASNAAVFEMRRDLIAHLMSLDLSYFDRTKSGDILHKVVGQAGALGSFVGLETANAVRYAVTAIAVSSYLIWMNALLFCSTVLVMPFILWVIRLVSARVRRIQKLVEKAHGDYMGSIDETVSGMRTVKIARQEPMERARLMRDSEKIRTLGNKVQLSQALFAPAIHVSSAFVYVLIIGGGGYMVLSPGSGMDGASIITFLLGTVIVFDPIRLLAQYIGTLQARLVMLADVRSLYSEVSRIADAPDATDSFDAGGGIEFRSVNFSYAADQPVFEGFDAVFEGKKVSAVVGPTGAGKTTVLALMTRLYEADGGEILIGGVPIGRIRLDSLRGAFSVVAQDIVIFDNSIWENIRYANPDATDEEVWQAAENAEIAQVMRERGDAPVGPKGAQLSGGQKQRIAIARAFLSDAPILLLDEATSALDQATEARIKSALNRLSKGRTTIIVTHRLAAVTDADRIFVLESGRLAEQGTYDELMQADGLFRRLQDTQGAASPEADSDVIPPGQEAAEEPS